jgi:hypothetical protein
MRIFFTTVFKKNLLIILVILFTLLLIAIVILVFDKRIEGIEKRSLTSIQTMVIPRESLRLTEQECRMRLLGPIL